MELDSYLEALVLINSYSLDGNYAGSTVEVFDSERLYTNIPLGSLIDALDKLVEAVYSHKNAVDLLLQHPANNSEGRVVVEWKRNKIRGQR